jgi:glycogen synthase
MAGEQARRVLLTADTVGGVWTYAFELSTELAARGVRIELATMGARLNTTQHAQIANVPNLTLHESDYKLEWMDEPWDDIARAGAWLLRLERELRPDVVHLNQFAFGALSFRAPTLIVAHSCVCSWWRAVHGICAPSSWDRYRAVVAQGLTRACLVAAPTHAMLATLRENYGFARAGMVLPNGRSSRTLKPARKKNVVLAAGRVWDAAKNMRALDAVAPHVPWSVQIAGASTHPGGEGYTAQHVTLLGELASDVLAQRLAHAAIYAHPARYEPFGLSVLEAALCGCALVLGDIPSLREVWGESALYVPPEDHKRLREALLALISNAALRRRLSSNARQRAMHYSTQRMADACLAAYKRVLSGRRLEAGWNRTATLQENRACAS